MTVLTPPAALSWPVLCQFGKTGSTLEAIFEPKWIRVGPPAPLRALKNPGFPYVSDTFHEIATFAIKSIEGPLNDRPDLSGGTFLACLRPVWTVWSHFGRDFGAQVALTWAPGASLSLEKQRFSSGF